MPKAQPHGIVDDQEGQSQHTEKDGHQHIRPQTRFFASIWQRDAFKIVDTFACQVVAKLPMQMAYKKNRCSGKTVIKRFFDDMGV